MSSKGIFTALSGAMAQNQKLDTIANNIANVNTPSFKKDAQVFREYLTAHEKQPDVIQVPKVPASVESFYDLQAADRGYVDASGSYTDFTQGSLRPTGNRLDLAIEGKGFFEVLAPQGVRYARAGNLAIDGQGRLVTKQGYPVLSKTEAEDPQSRTITITSPNISVSSSGEIFQDGQSVGALSVINVSQKEALLKNGMGMYSLKENYNAQVDKNPDVKIHQGFVENSNVNIIQEMTDMIQATRVFESAQKAIKAFDSMDDRLVNEIPKL